MEDERTARYSRGVRQAATLIRRRWTVDVLAALAPGERRPSEIKAIVDGPISDKVLTETLQQAVAHGLIERREVTGRPGDEHAGVWYQLTPMGRSLLAALRYVAEWAQQWADVLPQVPD
ncbi:winged helix-turn-helix transcriptional regulator [Kibdelosporangium lantanae]|uniref:Winged helix-turn-helix transcriptional regulator n=1 Tax=Kibdelosporangium lantanae TaxID=1497396 RepID=A0ABW3MAZ6_9PSEU